MENTTTPEATEAAATTEEAKTRESGVYLIYTKDGLAERKTKKEALQVIKEVGADNVLKVYKHAKAVELSTKTQVSF